MIGKLFPLSFRKARSAYLESKKGNRLLDTGYRQRRFRYDEMGFAGRQ